jgi:hypothetical protein
MDMSTSTSYLKQESFAVHTDCATTFLSKSPLPSDGLLRRPQRLIPAR